MNIKKALIIFIRNAEAGKVKTRLAATIGNDRAFLIYQKLIEHTLTISKGADADKFVFYSSYIEVNDGWNGDHFAKRLQKGNNLGEKMRNAFTELFTEGYHLITIIGSDCPGITTLNIDKAFKALQSFDIVIGPAKDGGYYLLALKKMNSRLFNDICWSTDKVLTQTLFVCDDLHLSTHLLDELFDVDTEKDIIGLTEFLPAHI